MAGHNDFKGGVESLEDVTAGPQMCVRTQVKSLVSRACLALSLHHTTDLHKHAL